MARTSRTQRNRSAGATSLCLLVGLVLATLLSPTASAADLSLGSATNDVGSATNDVGSATKDVGSATKDVGSATKDVGSGTGSDAAKQVTDAASSAKDATVSLANQDAAPVTSADVLKNAADAAGGIDPGNATDQPVRDITRSVDRPVDRPKDLNDTLAPLQDADGGPPGGAIDTTVGSATPGLREPAAMIGGGPSLPASHLLESSRPAQSHGGTGYDVGSGGPQPRGGDNGTGGGAVQASSDRGQSTLPVRSPAGAGSPPVLRSAQVPAAGTDDTSSQTAPAAAVARSRLVGPAWAGTSLGPASSTPGSDPAPLTPDAPPSDLPGIASAGFSTTFIFTLFLALVPLLVLWLAATSSRLRIAHAPWRPAPFASLLERPG